MKSFVLRVGEMLINLVVAFGIILGVFFMLQGKQGVIVGLGVILLTIITSFSLYLFIDIRDKLSENNKLLQKIKQEN